MSSLATELQPIDWTTVEGSLFDWITDKLGLTDDRVIWQDQNVPQPAYPYISLKRSGWLKEGGVDETRTSTDLTQDPGKEIELLTTGPREFTLNIQAHLDEAAGSIDPGCDAVFLLSKLQASLGQLSVTEALFRDANIAVIEELTIEDISLVINGLYLNRASMDVRFRTTSQITERTGFMDKVELKSTDLGIDTTVDAS